MNDNGFQFNWRGMTREPQRTYPYPQSGIAGGAGAARAAYIASQAANMRGYRPLPDMNGYQPTLSDREESQPSNRMTQPEIASQQEHKRMLELREMLETNEAKIEELKQEYETLRREQEASVEDIEREIAANRAGIGDTAQYNTWRARVEARDASKAAREADDEYIKDTTLRRAKEAVRSASFALAMASGDYEKALARQTYESAVGDYNDLAKKYDIPPIQKTGGNGPEAADNQKIYLPSDVEEFIRKHTNKNGEWDSREMITEAARMADTLKGEEREKYQQALKVAITEAEGNAKRNEAKRKVNEFQAKLKAEAKVQLEGQATGEYTLNVDGNAVNVTVKTSPDGEKKQAIVDGKVIHEWRVE